MTSLPVKKALSALLRDPGNSTCADCHSQSHPRWASWSLGVFVCIKCAGVHRSLGTHISKVKSVDLDTWQEEHLRALVRMGNNERANTYYEGAMDATARAALPRTLLDAGRLQQFIRSKYEARKWVREGAELPPRAPGQTPVQTPAHTPSPAQTPSHTPAQTPVAAPARTPAQPLPSRSANSSLVNLEKLSTSLSNSSGGAANANASTASVNTNTNATAAASSRPDLKKSILSLYASTAKSHSATVAANAQAFRSGTAFATASTPAPNAAAPNAAPQRHGAAASTGNSASATPTPGATPNGSALSLDDDLFKNVWS
ncbi:GTPase-activating protein [Maudiozyma humilis]|uniref:GTPase-activating protein n=1 Tax=Maudiozyma humilis TaxID=51915 RepID=A0AAV5RUY4_MAUHU|nr:GTPase-activating protein [Kazachstania humilis]